MHFFVVPTLATTFPISLPIAIDVTGDRTTLVTSSTGYCANFFNHFETFHMLLLLLYGNMAVFQVTIFIIAITLYQSVTKSCCGKGLIHAHVSILLISTIGLNIVLLIILVPLGVKGASFVIASNTTVCVQQITLLITCLMNKTVRKRLWEKFH